MKTYGLTDKGKEREYNEDSIGMLSLSCGIHILAVCDGMGGAVGGKTASELARDTFLASIEEQIDILGAPSNKKMGEAILKTAAKAANTAVYARSREDEALCGMGCTLCALIYFEKEKRLLSVNVGDSRLYKISNKKIQQITKDHSYVQYLLDQGEISPDEAEDHPQKNLITRAIGIEPNVKPDIKSVKVPLLSPAYFLLCSDGLCIMLDDDRIKNTILLKKPLSEKAQLLVDDANEAGGYDNISVVLLSVNTKGEEAEQK